jgi:ESCRT-I complex subunit TSG101
MAPLPDKVTNWLANVLRTVRLTNSVDHPQLTLYQDYQDPGRTFRDVVEVLSNYPTLSPRTDIYSASSLPYEIHLIIKSF